MTSFYSRERGDYVVDAVCECGHLKREHGSKLRPLGRGRSLRLPNDGNCCAHQCDCERFTWAGWATAEEVESRLAQSKREIGVARMG